MMLYIRGMTTDLRSILDRVASGEITPDEGQRLLAASGRTPTTAAAAAPVERVALRVTGVKLTVLADPGVHTAVADGPHRVLHEGGTLVITSDLSTGDYATETPWSAFRTWVNSGFRPAERIIVRVNPTLPLDVSLTAGSLRLSGQQAPVSVVVEAGATRLENGRGPLQVSTRTGSAEISWQFTGSSAIAVELGSAAIRLLPGSDATVTVDSSVGAASVSGPEGSRGSLPGGAIAPFAVGEGHGSLAVNARLGSVDVTVP